MTRARLAEALGDLLAERPGLNAKQLVAGLLTVGLTVNRTAVNSVLYSDPVFRNDGTTPPRWRLATEAATAPAAAPVPAATPVPAGSTPTTKAASTRGLRLYGWQEDALAAWRDQGEHGVVEAVTGTGKTMVGIAAALDTLRCRQKVCVLVPTRELMAQWVAQLRKQVPPHTRIGKLGDGHNDTLRTCDVLVAIVNSARDRDLHVPHGRGLLVADECHRYGSEANKEALDERFGRRLGLSATYARSDDGHIAWLDPFFGGTCYRMDYRCALADEVTAHFNVALIGCRFAPQEREQYEAFSRTAAKMRATLINAFGVPAEPIGEFMKAVNELSEGGPGSREARRYLTAFSGKKKLLAETPSKAHALAQLAGAVQQADRTLVFTQTIEAAEAAADVLHSHGVTVEAVHSQLDPDSRRDCLRDFGSGELQAIVAPQILDEGVDVPAADLAVIVAASRTRRQMIQRMGRVLRRKADNRLARFAVLYVEGTTEDPSQGAHEDFLEEVTQVADMVQVFPAGSSAVAISAFLNNTLPAAPPGQPRWAGEPPRPISGKPAATVSKGSRSTAKEAASVTPEEKRAAELASLKLSVLSRKGHTLRLTRGRNREGDLGVVILCGCGWKSAWNRDTRRGVSEAEQHHR